jgi:DDE superfamily endonuclease
MVRTVAVSPGFQPCLVPYRLFAPSSPPTSSSMPDARPDAAPSAFSSANAPNWSCCSTNTPASPTSRSATGSGFTPTQFATGADAGLGATSPWTTSPAADASRSFPPLDQAVIKAIACETVCRTELPLSRQSLADLTRRSCQALGKPVSRSTVWRVLDGDAIKPWQYEHWIFPRDPQFAAKAGRVVDLYAGLWQHERLDPEDRIISADEKTSIQARVRCHATLGPAPGRRRRIEHEYERGGALQYLAAWDIQEGIVMGRCEATTGIEPFGRLVRQVMERPEYAQAPRVFWVVDNGSSHRGTASIRRMLRWYGNAILVHTPVHASWLNQVEIYFSLVQRKVLTPNDFTDLAAVEQRLRLYEELTNHCPRPFDWKFDRRKLTAFLRCLEAKRAAKSNP